MTRSQCYAWFRTCFLPPAALVAVSTTASALQQPDLARTILFDSSQVRSYSTDALIALLSRGSLDLNLSSTSGLAFVLPLRQPDVAATQNLPNPRARTVTINVEPTSRVHYPELVVNELVRRKPVNQLLDALKESNDWAQDNWLEVALSRVRGSTVDSTMAALARAGADNALGYLALLYFAEIGTPWALLQLDCQYAELPISSMERVDVVRLFGKYKFYPAALNLAETLDAMYLNLGDAALQSLLAMYPEGRSQFDSPVAAAAYWKRYLEEQMGAAHAPSCKGSQHR